MATWTELSPLDTVAISALPAAVRLSRTLLRERLDNEHFFYSDETGKTDVGFHMEGSGRAFLGLLSARHTPYAATVALGGDGRVWFDEDENATRAYFTTGGAWVQFAAKDPKDLAWAYTTGTCNVTASNATVTAGTTAPKWSVNNGARVGDVFNISVGQGGDGEYYRLIGAGASLTLDRVWGGSTLTNNAYSLFRVNEGTMGLGGGTLYGVLTTEEKQVASGGIGGLPAHDADGEAVRFEHTTSDPIEHADGSITYAKMKAAEGIVRSKIGSYTGDGTNPRSITGVGFEPDVVIILRTGAFAPVIRMSSMPANNSKPFTAVTFQSDELISLDSDGFTLGADGNNRVNQNAVVYYYIALEGS